MNSFFKRTICTLTATGCLLLCGCNQEEETGAGYLFGFALAGNPECLDPQFTDNPNAAAILPSLMEGLMRLDENGLPEIAGAEKYTISEDGLYYMFTLRDDCYWYNTEFSKDDAIPVTAQDYVFAFQRLFDSTTQSPYAQQFDCIKNAVPILCNAMDCTEIGVSAPDDSTVIFQLDEPNAEFLQLLCQPCAYPCNEEFFYATNGRYGLSPELLLCNGPFLLTQWSYDPYGNDNLMHCKKNATYYAADSVYPSQLGITIYRSEIDTTTSFSSGGTDLLLTDRYQQQYHDSKNYNVVSHRAQTLGLIFNPDDEMLQDQDLRRALAYGIDRTALAAAATEDLQVAYGVIPPAAKLLGRSYREIYADEPLALPYQPEEAVSLFNRASSKLGLHAMNTIRIIVPSTIVDTDTLLAVCQEWQNLFGYYIGLESVTPEEFDRRIAAGEYSIALYSVSGLRNSCRSVLETFSANPDYFGNSSSAFNSAMASAAGCELLSEAGDYYYSAEEALIEELLFIPLFYKNSYLYCSSNNTDLQFDAFTGAYDFRYAKHFAD